VGGPAAGWVVVGLANGVGGFGQWSWVSGKRVLDDDSRSWLADVNGDGTADLVTQGGPRGSARGRVSVGLSDGLRFAQWSWTSPGRMLDDDDRAWLVDVDGDKKADLVAQGGPSGAAAGWIALGLSNGVSFPQWTWTSGTRKVEDLSTVWLMDLDGDSQADLTTHMPSTGHIYTAFGSAAGFGQSWNWSW